MSCCGSKRQQVEARRDFGPVRTSAAPEPGPRGPAPGNGVLFAFYGVGELVVIGSASGRRYHFDQRGSRLPVDPRDAAVLEGHPRLRRISA
jgi:hypothetical protein